VLGRLACVTHDKDHAVVARRAAEPFTTDSILLVMLASHWKSPQGRFPVGELKVCSCFGLRARRQGQSFDGQSSKLK
jgi:hypothetical protein